MLIRVLNGFMYSCFLISLLTAFGIGTEIAVNKKLKLDYLRIPSVLFAAFTFIGLVVGIILSFIH